jgi:hypothetical protein
MLNLKAGYFNLLAVRIICLRFVKQLYFSTSFYNNSLKAKTPEQFYFYPNPYLLHTDYQKLIQKNFGMIIKMKKKKKI